MRQQTKGKAHISHHLGAPLVGGCVGVAAAGAHRHLRHYREAVAIQSQARVALLHQEAQVEEVLHRLRKALRVYGQVEQSYGF